MIGKMRWSALALIIVAVMIFGACRTTESEREPALPVGSLWNLAAAEDIDWQADDSHFSQRHSIEASGLTSSGRYLYATSEKYGAVLQIDTEAGYSARVVPLAVPPRTELEGVAYADGTLYLCDEAAASVFAVRIEDEQQLASEPVQQPLAATSLELGIDVEKGKVGIEGVAVESEGSRLYLALERRKSRDGTCSSLIFRLRIDDNRLLQDREPIELPLPGCDWRLTALELHQGRLLTLKTRYPDKDYWIVEIDPESGEWRDLVRLRELAAQMHDAGYGDNLEGMAVTAGGELYMVSDNAMTGIIEDQLPELAKEKTLLLRIPAQER
jgi:uncharacterized protein YjiK